MPKSYPKIKAITLPYIPKQVDQKDLKENNLLLNQQQIEAAKKYFAKHPDESYLRKKKLKADFSVVHINGKLFAVYRGAKQDAHLGNGGFGIVKLAQNLETGEWVALKTLDTKNDFNNEATIYFGEREFKALEKAGLSVGKIGLRKNKHRLDIFQILMKLAPGEDLKSLNKNQKIPAAQRLTIAMSVAEVLQDLFFNKRMVHRDIKGANIIANLNTNHVSLVDFCFAAPLNEKNEVVGVCCGTDSYIAPEIIQQNKIEKDKCTYNEKTEVFAFGVTLRKWFGIGRDLPGNIGTYFEKYIPDSSTRNNLVALIKKMTNANPEKRPNMAAVIGTLKEINQNYLYFPARTQAVALIPVNAVYPLAKKPEDLDLLKKFDQVLLIDSYGIDLEYYLGCKKWLESEQIKVREVVYTSDTLDNILESLPELIDKEKPNNLNQYFFITNQKKSIKNSRITYFDPKKDDFCENLFKQKVAEADYVKINNILESEIDRLKEKYSRGSFNYKIKFVKKRIENLEELIAQFAKAKNNQNYTYDALVDDIDDAQDSLTANSISSKFMKFFDGKTHTEKLLQHIEYDIESSIWKRELKI